MESHNAESSLTLEGEANDYTGSSSQIDPKSAQQEERVELPSSSPDGSEETADVDNQHTENADNQLVLYDPAANGTREIEPVPQPSQSRLPPRALSTIGDFTVQCAHCFKWRLIPTKEKYEEIRERILEQPFYCETAREWRPDISCDDPADISQDGSRLWAIDKPSIAKPPPGWQRILRIRGVGSSKFADVYYQAPAGKRLRSMVEVQKYLLEHPEYIRDGVTLARFSFQTPKPLQDNYVRKRPARITASADNTKPLEPANLLPWVGSDDSTKLQLGRPSLGSVVSDSFDQPPKKAKKMPLKHAYNSNPACNQPGMEPEEHSHSINNSIHL